MPALLRAAFAALPGLAPTREPAPTPASASTLLLPQPGLAAVRTRGQACTRPRRARMTADAGAGGNAEATTEAETEPDARPQQLARAHAIELRPELVGGLPLFLAMAALARLQRLVNRVALQLPASDGGEGDGGGTVGRPYAKAEAEAELEAKVEAEVEAGAEVEADEATAARSAGNGSGEAAEAAADSVPVVLRAAAAQLERDEVCAAAALSAAQLRTAALESELKQMQGEVQRLLCASSLSAQRVAASQTRATTRRLLAQLTASQTRLARAVRRERELEGRVREVEEQREAAREDVVKLTALFALFGAVSAGYLATEMGFVPFVEAILLGRAVP